MTRLLRAACAALLLASCDSLVGSDEPARLTGYLRDARWSGSAEVRPGPADAPYLRSQMPTTSGTLTIGVNLPAGTVGTYAIEAGEAWYDAAPRYGDAYWATAVEGTLVIRRIGEGRMSGTLEITFRGLDGAVFRFTDGAFTARLPQPALPVIGR